MLFKPKFIRVLLLCFLLLAGIFAVYWSKDSFISAKENNQKDKNSVSVEILLKEWTITPQNMTVEKGKTISLSVVNQGSYPHDFVIKELGIKTQTLAPGQKEILTFVAEQSVTLESYCSLPGHKESGMAAKLLIK